MLCWPFVLKPDQESVRSQVATRSGACRLSSSFRGLEDSAKLCQLFDAVKSFSDFAHDAGLYEASYHLEDALDSILLYKDRVDRGVFQFKTRRTLSKERAAQVKELLNLRAKMIDQIVANVSQ